jgi:hypothetical protein
VILLPSELNIADDNDKYVTRVGAAVGVRVGIAVVGLADGAILGSRLGLTVGAILGLKDINAGDKVGPLVGETVGI